MLKTFPKGGVHPPENKITADKAIEDLPLPPVVQIPVAQHIGAPAEVLVKRGDHVLAGQLVARSAGFISANIHSSVSGKVTKIHYIMDSSGYKKQALEIEVDHSDKWMPDINLTNEILDDLSAATPELVREKALEAGIVGLGGATFPTHVKLNIPKGKTAEYLIINGVECEPYLTADHRLMVERGHELMLGIKLAMLAIGVNKCLIGIENNKPDAINNLKQLATSFEGVEVVPLKVQYPQGGEKQLIKALLNREVPSGGLPLAVGCVVLNVGSTLALYNAVQKNRPVVTRIVTLTGKSVKKPGNYCVRIGTPVNFLIDYCGGLPSDTEKVINGGPMMGKALNQLDVPLTKGSSGILIIKGDEARRHPEKPCIRCSRCVQACPAGLEPYLLQTLGIKQMHDRAEAENITDCIECGSCSYICPSDRALLDFIRLAKTQVIKNIRSRSK